MDKNIGDILKLQSVKNQHKKVRKIWLKWKKKNGKKNVKDTSILWYVVVEEKIWTDNCYNVNKWRLLNVRHILPFAKSLKAQQCSKYFCY